MVHEVGAPPGPVVTKDDVRSRTWQRMMDAGLGAFPFPLTGRIPNFKGAGHAARRLADHEAWEAATVVKANPDAPQRYVRERALRDGKLVLMAVPRLTQEACFLRLDPNRLGEAAREAASIRGAGRLGEAVTPETVPHVDLVVSGSVAVDRHGTRVGKGGGYADLEFGLLADVGAVDPATVVVTTVHDVQLVEETLPREAHDVPLDVVVTPTRVVEVEAPGPRPEGLLPALLTEDDVAAMPPVARRLP